MKKLNFLVIGTNFISDKFCLAADELDDVSVAAVYSRGRESGESFAAKHSIERVYTDLDLALADSTVDAVYVASPTFLHKEHSVRSLMAGKHVLCEKSIALSSSELAEMISASKGSGRVLLEAMRPAYDPALKIIKENLPKIGKIRRASLEFCQYSSRYDRFKTGIVENAFNPEIGNSALSDIGVYPLWLAIELFGKPRKITSEKKYLHNGFLGMGISVLDYGEKYVSVAYSKITDSTSPSFIEGENGSIIIDKISEPSSIFLKLRGKEKIDLGYTPCNNNMVYEIAEFKKMTEGKVNFSQRLEISAEVMAAQDVIHKSE